MPAHDPLVALDIPIVGLLLSRGCPIYVQIEHQRGGRAMRVRENLVAGKHASHPSVTERFTEATSRAIHFAQSESLRRGASATTVADLLAGLGVDENSRAERIGSLKVNAFYLRWLVGLPALPARAEQ